jgi:hypothetical protein
MEKRIYRKYIKIRKNLLDERLRKYSGKCRENPKIDTLGFNINIYNRPSIEDIKNKSTINQNRKFSDDEIIETIYLIESKKLEKLIYNIKSFKTVKNVEVTNESNGWLHVTFDYNFKEYDNTYTKDELKKLHTQYKNLFKDIIKVINLINKQVNDYKSWIKSEDYLKYVINLL